MKMVPGQEDSRTCQTCLSGLLRFMESLWGQVPRFLPRTQELCPEELCWPHEGVAAQPSARPPLLPRSVCRLKIRAVITVLGLGRAAGPTCEHRGWPWSPL